ncbi:hypothetical protein FIBSPDRAFT_929149 [Athelia psychrophila]|uniref:Carbohydrate-binding module family 19 domain-containing protein n=1 Tax=Athelia psychrophila TaxID=1759441 RepID=A0A166P570_9AGAM|nr:hypothetical protein FIBSPDRAFT_929149 [Fibularhizoctonia sp. CBS 109695]
MYQLLMRFLSPFVLVVLFALPFVSAAPTALGPSALLQNGIAAQQLNAAFLTLKATDPCNSSDVACVSGLPAQCSKMGVWKTEKCSGGKSKSCFALPLVRANGTFLACTSKADALSIISATGSQGGITGDGHATSGSPNGSSRSTAPDSGSTVTVTLAVPAGSSVTLPPATRTIGSSEASSILSILAADATSSSQTAAASPANTAGAVHVKLTASATAPSSSTGANSNTKTATSSS